MNATPPSGPGPGAAPAVSDEVLDAWPRSTQAAFAALLLLIVALIGLRSIGRSRASTRPTESVSAIDLNEADQVLLAQVPGLGPRLAAQIEKDRLDRGPFRSVDDLDRVSGVGKGRLDALKPWFFVRTADDGEARPVLASKEKLPSGTPARKGDNLTAPVDVNRAGVEELQQLPGIGPKLAQNIVEARRRAPFTSVEDLNRVPGIGPKILQKLRPLITVGSPPGNRDA